MDAEAYKVALNRCDSKISEMERTIHNLRNKIAEAEEARENAKGIRDDLDYCERELSRLKQQRNTTYYEYMRYLKSLEEEVE